MATYALSRAVLLVQFLKHLCINLSPHLLFPRKRLALVLALHTTSDLELTWPPNPHMILDLESNGKSAPQSGSRAR